MADGVPATSSIYQDSPHGFRSDGKEVGLILPLLVFLSGESQPGFVDEHGCLDGLARGFTRQLRGG